MRNSGEGKNIALSQLRLVFIEFSKLLLIMFFLHIVTMIKITAQNNKNSALSQGIYTG